MINNLYKTFVDATRNVFNLMLHLSEISDHPGEDFKCDEEVDIAVSIVGDLEERLFTASQSPHLLIW